MGIAVADFLGMEGTAKAFEAHLNSLDDTTLIGVLQVASPSATESMAVRKWGASRLQKSIEEGATGQLVELIAKWVVMDDAMPNGRKPLHFAIELGCSWEL